MTRILFWCSRFRPHIGGIPIMCDRLLAALRVRGYELAVITQQDQPDLPVHDLLEGMPIYRLPFWQAFERQDGAQMQRLRQKTLEIKRDFRPDLVHMFHIGPEAFFELQTRAAVPSPLVCSLHSMYPDAVFSGETVVRHLLNAAARVAAPSAAIYRQIIQGIPAVTTRSSVIYNAVEELSPLPGPPPAGAPRLLCVGRLIEEKGFDLAVAAFAVIHAAHAGVELTVAGDGPARPRLEEQARALGVADAVTFTGWIEPSAVPALIQASTIVLMPSRTEGLPLVSLQTAQMARPLIAAQVGGLPEVVLDGRTGLLVAPDDVQALAAAITRLLDAPALAARMGRAALSHVAQTFNWYGYVNAYEHIYDLALRGNEP